VDVGVVPKPVELGVVAPKGVVLEVIPPNGLGVVVAGGVVVDVGATPPRILI